MALTKLWSPRTSGFDGSGRKHSVARANSRTIPEVALRDSTTRGGSHPPPHPIRLAAPEYRSVVTVEKTARFPPITTTLPSPSSKCPDERRRLCAARAEHSRRQSGPRAPSWPGCEPGQPLKARSPRESARPGACRPTVAAVSFRSRRRSRSEFPSVMAPGP